MSGQTSEEFQISVYHYRDLRALIDGNNWWKAGIFVDDTRRRTGEVIRNILCGLRAYLACPRISRNGRCRTNQRYQRSTAKTFGEPRINASSNPRPALIVPAVSRDLDRMTIGRDKPRPSHKNARLAQRDVGAVLPD